MENVLSRIDNNYKILKFSGTRADFATLMENNPGILIFKFTAEWCGPCKKIKDYTYMKSNELPDYMTMMEVDVDECFDLYAYLKQKKMVSGIPVMLAYKAGNDSYAPDASVSGIDETQLKHFFDTCLKMMS